jgi:hypothetical protein
VPIFIKESLNILVTCEITPLETLINNLPIVFREFVVNHVSALNSVH